MQYGNEHTLGDVHLKPMLNAQVSAYSGNSFTAQDPYKPVASDAYLSDNYTHQQAADTRLKYRIRVLKLVSRIVALVLSLTTLVPLAMTLAKFFATKDTILVVNGQERTAWAHDSITWYTYMYFAISLVSFVFNLVIVAAYWRGIKKANNVASIASWWSTTVLVGHVLVWIISAALYRYGKIPVDGKFRDLWGWTCSPVARAIQTEVPNVNFDQYCKVQSASFYSGLANIAAGILSALILLLASLRSRSKKRVERLSTQQQVNLEPLRY